MSLKHPPKYYAIKYATSFMRMAEQFGENSPAGDKKVGCLIYLNNDLVALGFNGMAPGSISEETRNPDGTNREGLLHGEHNAIQKLVDDGCEHLLEGAVVFVTLLPCKMCAELLIKYGVSKVYYTRDYKCHNGLGELWVAGIETEQLEECT